MSALPVVLPFLQARAELHLVHPPARPALLPVVQASATVPPQPRTTPQPHLAFYRKYTEALLRRYMRMSLQVGRVPCVLSRAEMFRAKVSNYRMESFEDVVIFCHDVERCIQRLTAIQQSVIDLMAVKQYTLAETAPLLGLCREVTIRHYMHALDRLTGIFIEAEILNLSKCCQAPESVQNAPTE